MSDTPRTDAAEVDMCNFSDWGTGPSGYVEAVGEAWETGYPAREEG